MADEQDDARTFEPISNLTPAGLGRGMLNRARTQGEGIARQVAQNYQDILRLGRDAVSPILPRASSGLAPWESRPAEMTEAPFAQASSDPGVRVGAQIFDPANLVGSGGSLAVKTLKQAATARALRAAEAEQALAKKSADWIASPAGRPDLQWLGASSQRGFIEPKTAGAIAGTGLGAYGLSRVLRGEKQPDDPAARTTANAFRQQQETMDAVNEELRRQSGRGAIGQHLNRMEQQLEREGK